MRIRDRAGPVRHFFDQRSSASVRAASLAAALASAAAMTALLPLAGTAGATAMSSGPAAKFVRSCALPAKPRVMACMALRRTGLRTLRTLAPGARPPNGYGPSDLHSAYELPSDRGKGTTVAIVDAFNDPNVEPDLAAYRAQYGLPPCTKASGCLSVVNQNGAASPLPSNDGGWAGEISLDVDMVSATCPFCRILLVEANSNGNNDLFTAVDYAAQHATFVSNSYGGSRVFQRAWRRRAFQPPWRGDHLLHRGFRHRGRLPGHVSLCHGGGRNLAYRRFRVRRARLA